MAKEPEKSSQENPPLSSSDSISHSAQTLGQSARLWIDYAVEQSRLYQKTIEETFESLMEASRSRFSEIRSTSAAHFSQTIDSLEDVKSNYSAYEDILFAKIKEGVLVAASHPMITCGVTTGLGFVVLKRPRRFLYHKTLRLFVSEEVQSLLSRADAKVKELRHSTDLLKAESEKLVKRAVHAEEELIRGWTKFGQTGKQIESVIHSTYKIERQVEGFKDSLGELPRREASLFRSQSFLSRTYAKEMELRHSIDLLNAESEKLLKRQVHAKEEFMQGWTKLRQTVKQIPSVIHSAYKIERQAEGLKDFLGELPRREASLFRSQVSKLASEAKKERNDLTKEVTKISSRLESQSENSFTGISSLE